MTDGPSVRRMIAAMKLSVDGKTEGPDGLADWVHGWSDDYGLTAQVDACVLGGGMYPGYEQYWTAIQNAPTAPTPLGVPPTPAELQWVGFAANVPHYVVSRSRTAATWPRSVHFLRDLDQVAELKRQPGKDIYLMGGARIVRACLAAGLVDQLRLIAYPLVAGTGTTLFTAPERQKLELREVEALDAGRVRLTYDVLSARTLATPTG